MWSENLLLYKFKESDKKNKTVSPPFALHSEIGTTFYTPGGVYPVRLNFGMFLRL